MSTKLDFIHSRRFEHDDIDNEMKRKVKYKILYVKLNVYTTKDYLNKAVV